MLGDFKMGNGRSWIRTVRYACCSGSEKAWNVPAGAAAFDGAGLELGLAHSDQCSYLLKGGRPLLGKHLKLEEAAAVGIAEAIRALALPLADVEDAFQAAAALA